MAQCKAQHTVGTTIHYCVREVEDGHTEHVDFMDLAFDAEPPKAGVEIVDFAEVVADV